VVTRTAGNGITGSGRRQADHTEVIRRIRSEYLEMPGLKLTFAQARRLWSLDTPTCAAALHALTVGGFLRRTTRGAYVRRETMASHRSRHHHLATRLTGRGTPIA
jgi:hypothetical protein